MVNQVSLTPAIGPLLRIRFLAILSLSLACPGSVTSRATAGSLLERWERLEKGVRDGRLPADAARAELAALMPLLRREFPAIGRSLWAFPVQGGAPSWIGGVRGEGFHPSTPAPAYSWFDGNRHGGHPAHDIFVPDKDRDCLDDRIRRPFTATAMQAGVVLSINETWAPGQPRGGKYVWIYSSALDAFFYYAHLAEIHVKPGDRVQSGATLGLVGRTGLTLENAGAPCHIHLTVLRYDDGRMTPLDFYPMISTP